jgi:hypothetical protein
LSPEGSGLAYQSIMFGRWQVLLRAFTDAGTEFPVAAGTAPVWSADGRTLWFLQGMRLLATDVRWRPQLAATPPRIVADGVEAIVGAASDGRLLVRRRAPAERATLDVVMGWTHELKALLGHEPLPRSFR